MISIILVRPRNPQNIGAAARAMGNFGLADLRIVEPYEPTWREAVSAVGAHEILTKAQVFSTLPEAVSDANIILATTALKNRKVGQQIVSLPSVNAYLADYTGQNISIIFGPEKTGLTNVEIAMAHTILNIPTTAEVPSINLAQAVILCCYELSKNKISSRQQVVALMPTAGETEIVINNLQSLLAKLDFPPTVNEDIRTRHLRSLNSKGLLSREDIFFINTVITKINKTLKS